MFNIPLILNLSPLAPVSKLLIETERSEVKVIPPGASKVKVSAPVPPSATIFHDDGVSGPTIVNSKLSLPAPPRKNLSYPEFLICVMNRSLPSPPDKVSFPI